MTTAEAISLFKILQDKYASPHLTDGEILKFLNMAQYERLNRLIPDDMGGVTALEQDQNVLMNIRPFVYNLTGFTITAGFLSNSAVSAALVSKAGAGSELFRVLNINYDGKPAKFTRHNNILREETNVFKQGGQNIRKYVVLADGYQFYPSLTSAANSMTVVKKPFSITLNVNPEWDDYNMNLILMLALQLAGISTRDEEVIMDIRNTTTTK